LGNVGLTGEPDHDVQLLQLDVDGIVVLDEEHLHLVLENVGPLLDDQVNVPQRHILNLSHKTSLIIIIIGIGILLRNFESRFNKKFRKIAGAP
jgi:hypothetical protein